MFFFCKIKDTFFSPITSLIWVFWACQLSPVWYNVDFSQLMPQFDCYQLVYPTVEHHPARNMQYKNLQTTFDIFAQSQHLLHTLHKSFFVCFSFIFTFLKVIQHKMLKICILSSIFKLKRLPKNSPILIRFLKMSAGMTAVTIQSNKIVSNVVEDN